VDVFGFSNNVTVEKLYGRPGPPGSVGYGKFSESGQHPRSQYATNHAVVYTQFRKAKTHSVDLGQNSRVGERFTFAVLGTALLSRQTPVSIWIQQAPGFIICWPAVMAFVLTKTGAMSQ